MSAAGQRSASEIIAALADRNGSASDRSAYRPAGTIHETLDSPDIDRDMIRPHREELICWLDRPGILSRLNGSVIVDQAIVIEEIEAIHDR